MGLVTEAARSEFLIRLRMKARATLKIEDLLVTLTLIMLQEFFVRAFIWRKVRYLNYRRNDLSYSCYNYFIVLA
jgi:hypothetical protein